MNQNDPTDNALAAIASILDQPPVIPRERERPAAESAPVAPPPLPPPSLEEYYTPPPLEVAPAPDVAPALEVAPPLETSPRLERSPPVEAHGYSKIGPGPMAAIRFKWTVREDQGDYYVDETIGENSTPQVTGPMGREAAVQLVDDREAAARRRFEQLKAEMAGRTAAANLVRRDSGEA